MSCSRLAFFSPATIDSKLAKEKNYWLQRLSGDLLVSGIPLDFRRPAFYWNENHVVKLEIGDDVRSELLRICNGADWLALAVFVAALKVCLHKYTGIEDIIIGTTISQHHPETARLNKVLVLRDRVSATATARELILQVRRTLIEAYENQKYPFDRILNLFSMPYPENRAPLFNVVAAIDADVSREHIEPLKNDLSVFFSFNEDGLTSSFEYNPLLFKRESIEVFAGHYEQTLRAMVGRPDEMISRIELLSAAKRGQLVLSFNNTSREYPRNSTIHELFEQQATVSAYDIAVECDSACLTYEELNGRANQLAHYLKGEGIGPGAKVGICMEHSFETLVAILGVLKSGGAYVPLDPAHPQARLHFMLEDAAAPIVLTQERLANRLPSATKSLRIDAEWDDIAVNSRENLSAASPRDLAYVIYTSGSTGSPKGVQIEHASLVNYIWWAKQEYLAGERFDFPLYSSLAFDLTVTSIFTPLVSGNRVVIYRSEDKASLISEIIKDNKVGVLKLTPSHLALIKNADNSTSHIRRLIVGGEALETELARQVHQSFGGHVEIINEYGPTEATVGCMIYRFDPDNDDRAYVPVGRPAANAQIYLLDEELKPVAENIVAELYVSGDGLARGYLNREALTSERFIENPFAPGARMYRTGDLARWLPEGVIEYIGRKDEQIKYHGYRIELNEIRSALNRHPQISDSIASFVKDHSGEGVLMAYYVSRQELDPAQLRAFLQESLIEETLPNIFVHLKRLPLTLNGKVNHGALPTLEEARRRLTESYVGPRNKTEQTLADMWAAVLGVERVGIHDNFFALGGHSLVATQVISRVRDAFKLELPIRRLFEFPTVASFAQAMSLDDANATNITDQTIKKERRGNAEQLLAKLDTLSDEEVASLLDQMVVEEVERNEQSA